MATPKPEPDESTVEQFVHDHPSGASFEEVAEVLGVSRQRVQALERKALLKLHSRFSGQLASDYCPDCDRASPAQQMASLGDRYRD